MNTRHLLKRLTAPIEKFAQLGDTVYTEHGPMTYIDNKSDVLAVAHLDWVLFNAYPKITKQYQNVKIEDCPQLDDRLGVWMILDVFHRAGIKCDILLCDSEETGNSTSKHFPDYTNKKYNWMVEFDRAGSDMVMYDYETRELEDIFESLDYQVGYGSFTDICELNTLGCKGFNFGVGYHGQHTKNCYANLAETFDSFRKFQTFYAKYKNTHFPHDEYEYSSRVSNFYTPLYETVKPKIKSLYKSNSILIDEDIKIAEPQTTVDAHKESIAGELYAQSYKWLSSKQKEAVNKEVELDRECINEYMDESSDWLMR